jgi:hypothetical protein
MARILPRLLARSIVLLVAGAGVFGGCSRQAEGERCDYEWAGETQDCNDGLVCTPCGNLQDHVVDRCCPSDGSYTDPRCTPVAGDGTSCSSHQIAAQGSGGTSSSSTGGSSSSGAGEAGMSGANASGG